MASNREHAVLFEEHELVPKHDILSESEGKKVLQELNTTQDRLPKIFESDPALKGKGKAGQIVRIIREDVPGIKYPYYRLIIEG